jgi:hypothetical protein
VHFHAGRLPNLNEVATHRPDLIEVASHLVVQQGKPISNPKDKDTPSIHKSVDVERTKQALSYMHPTTGLEPIVTNGEIDVLQYPLQPFLVDDLLSDQLDQPKAFREG